MRPILKFAALALVVSFVSFGAVQAHDKGYECTEGVDYRVTTVVTDNGPVYVTQDEILTDNHVVSAWIYAESNGMPGLQRHDDYCYNPGITDANRDTIVL